MEADAIVIVDPACGLVDAAVIDSMIAHADKRDELEYCFTQAPPGIGGVLIRPAMLNRPG
jgi:hypothetical protein